MMLSELRAQLFRAHLSGDGDTEITDLAYDSRSARRGSLFFAVPGSRMDGHDYARDAVARGAAALVVERPLDLGVPELVVPAVRDAMGVISATFFGHPSRAMLIAGVTGTNGKTTTTFMLEHCFRAAGMVPGVVGTVETHIGSERIPVTRTTPESVDLQRLLARMRDAGVGAVAMEVSSHGLDLGRVSHTTFACATFTNLTRDHLDYHGTMERYYRAKARLFDGKLAPRGAVNVDDRYGRRLAREAAVEVMTFALDRPADVKALDVRMDRTGSHLRCSTPEGIADVRIPIIGRYNISNALGTIATCLVLGIPLAVATAGVAALSGVPGRLESISAGQPFSVLVDYAHTPDSLAGVLRAAREICEGRLTVVFGCGGDRDRGKRPAMGKIGATLADHAIITSDNPRSERPEVIMAEIEAGARRAGGSYEIEADRRAAIRAAVESARPGDVVVIAGKGHETGQQFADRTIPFDDRIVAREELERCFR